MFKLLQSQIEANFANLRQSGPVFIINLDKDEIWQKYLDGFSESDRQSNNCNCCKSFLRQFAGIVGVDSKNALKTIWDGIDWSFEGAEEYKKSVESINKWIKSHDISDIFLHNEKHCGTHHSLDGKKGITWNHYHLELPKDFIKPNVDTIKGDKRANKDVLQRSLNELTQDSVETSLELIAQNSLYRGNEHKSNLEGFLAIQKEYKGIKNTKSKSNFCWLKSFNLSPAVCRIKNTAIGTLLSNLSEGMELDKAVAAFERVVAPANYKRPTAIITPKMIEAAQNRLRELGLEDCLNRRHITEKDLSVAENGVLYAHRKAKKVNSGIFDALKEDLTVNPKTLSKIEEISIIDFLEKVIPTAKSIQVLIENKHVGNFMSLLGPEEGLSADKSKNLFKWDNLYSWSYTGGVADNMRNRVAELGGRVDGVLRFTHSWNHPEMGRNTSLMDLHVFMPSSTKHSDGCNDDYPSGQRVGWNNRNDYISGGVQDVDYINAAPEGYIPIENISFPNMKKLKNGKYTFKIHNWQLREGTKAGFRAEIEFGGQIYKYEHPAPLKNKEWVTLAEATLKDGVFSIENKMESRPVSQVKWGIGTEKFHDVSHVLLSPNHWNTPTGNKHYFFILDGCKSDETSRPFYNEFLKQELDKDRKVFEVLAGKIKVENVPDGAQELSGVGFSETVRNELIVKVSGKFDRILRIKF